MTVAVYAGSFDPITNGHVSVVRQAVRVFSHVRILVAVNPTKDYLFSRAERVDMIRRVVGGMPQVSVAATSDLVVAYAKEIGASFLVRGIRGKTDAEFETWLAQENRAIAPEILTVLLPAEPALSAVSSSGLKARVQRGEPVGEACPPEVLERLQKKLQEAR